MSAQAEAQINDLWNANFSPYGEGGIAKWSNWEVMRRMLAQLGATYGQPNTLPFKPLPRPADNETTPPVTIVSLSPSETAALAAIPAILAILQRIEAADKSA
jgi:hypothetical protein